MGYPSPRSWKVRKETTSLAQGRGTASPSAGALQCTTSFSGSSPFSAKRPAPPHLHWMVSSSTSRSELTNGSMSSPLPRFTLFLLGTTAAHERAWREGRRRRGNSWGIGEGTGRKPSPFTYLRRRLGSWRKAKDWGKKPSPFPHSRRRRGS